GQQCCISGICCDQNKTCCGTSVGFNGACCDQGQTCCEISGRCCSQ
ncbi:15889_t:CDS:2, partial [Gigaspora rosea]